MLTVLVAADEPLPDRRYVAGTGMEPVELSDEIRYHSITSKLWVGGLVVLPFCSGSRVERTGVSIIHPYSSAKSIAKNIALVSRRRKRKALSGTKPKIRTCYLSSPYPALGWDKRCRILLRIQDELLALSEKFLLDLIPHAF